MSRIYSRTLFIPLLWLALLFGVFFAGYIYRNYLGGDVFVDFLITLFLLGILLNFIGVVFVRLLRASEREFPSQLKSLPYTVPHRRKSETSTGSGIEETEIVSVIPDQPLERLDVSDVEPIVKSVEVVHEPKIEMSLNVPVVPILESKETKIGDKIPTLIDEGQNQPDNIEAFPEQPNNIEAFPEQPDNIEAFPEQPDNIEAFPEQPDNIEAFPERPDNIEAFPEQPDNIEAFPEQPDNIEAFPEQPDNIEAFPEQPDNIEAFPEQPANIKAFPEQSVDIEVIPAQSVEYKAVSNNSELHEEMNEDWFVELVKNCLGIQERELLPGKLEFIKEGWSFIKNFEESHNNQQDIVFTWPAKASVEIPVGGKKIFFPLFSAPFAFGGIFSNSAFPSESQDIQIEVSKSGFRVLLSGEEFQMPFHGISHFTVFSEGFGIHCIEPFREFFIHEISPPILLLQANLLYEIS